MFLSTALLLLVPTNFAYVLNTNYHSRGYQTRPEGKDILFLVLHYTAGNFQSSLTELTQNPDKGVQYLLPSTPPTDGSDWVVYQLVEEKFAAYHAGVSQWQNYTSLNYYSIGIEIVNLGLPNPYPAGQIAVLMQLCQDIIARNKIRSTFVVGHSDVAPTRKIDPGPLFPWYQLYQNGIGFWYGDLTKLANLPLCCSISCLQQLLKIIGYQIPQNGCQDGPTTNAISAFQQHFRPATTNGVIDKETCQISYSIGLRYFENQMASINITTVTCSGFNFRPADYVGFTIRTDYQSLGYADRPAGVNIGFVHIIATGPDLQTTLNDYTGPDLSVHFVVPDKPGSNGWEIYQLVEESKMAYHAGLSEWQDQTALNGFSIGISVVNAVGVKFPDDQISILAKLISQIQSKYNISVLRVVGHSDVSPTRSSSPGPLFPWQLLYSDGVGFWPDQADIQTELTKLQRCDVLICLQLKLHLIGYDITIRGENDAATTAAIKAFQMRFRPANYYGTKDLETCAIVNALVHKYFYKFDFCPLDS